MAKRILVVDDEKNIRSVVRMKLELDGYTVVEASSGAQALEFVAADPPDLILLDVTMRGLDGYAVCAHLRSEPQSAQIPIVIMSAKAQPQEKRRFDRFNIEDFIVKPFNMVYLAKRIRQIVEPD